MSSKQPSKLRVSFRESLDPETFFVSISSIGVIAAAVTWFYQIFKYLNSGEWHPISLLWIFQKLGNQWSIQPRSWFGMHEIMDWIPLGIFSFVFGIVLGFLAAIIATEIQESLK
jgi:hypothetical protein